MPDYIMYMCVYKMSEAETIRAFEGAGFRVCMPPDDYDYHNAFYWLCKTIHMSTSADYFAHIKKTHQNFMCATNITAKRLQFDVRCAAACEY